MNHLIINSLEKGDLTDLERVPRVLLSDNEKKVIDWIDGYRFKYYELPTVERLAMEFPEFPISQPHQSVGLLEQAITRRKSVLLNHAYTRLSSASLAEAREIIRELNEMLMAEVGGEINLRHFDRSKHFIRNEKYPMFTVSITEAMGGGVGRGEMAVIIGQAGVGKSMAVIDLATKYMLEDKTVLVVSVDMATHVLLARIDASLLHVSAQDIRSGEMEGDKRLDVLQHISKYLPGEIIVPDETVRSTNQISAMLKKHEADVLIVDGLYLLRSMASGHGSVRGWENVASVSEELKTMAQNSNIPVISVSQANRQGEVGYSLALMQEADAVITLEKSDVMLPGKESHKIISVKFLKNRNGPMAESTIIVDFDSSSIRDAKIFMPR